MQGQNLKKDNHNKEPNGGPVEIQPVAFRPSSEKPRTQSFRVLKWLLTLVLGGLLILLGVSAWFVFTAHQVVIRIDPNPDQLSIRGGGIAPKIGDYYLLRPGSYTLEAFKECYQPLSQDLMVITQKKQMFSFNMTKEPGRLSFQAH